MRTAKRRGNDPRPRKAPLIPRRAEATLHPVTKVMMGKRVINKDTEMTPTTTSRTRAHQHSSSIRRPGFSGTFIISRDGGILWAPPFESRPQRGLNVNVTSCDLATGCDLALDEPFIHHLADAKAGNWDGFHAGFPCASFSKARWKEIPGGPPPVRSREFPYGIPGQPHHRQAEADLGTILAARSVLIAEAVLNSSTRSGIKPPVSLENPPPSAHPQHLSAWELPEVKTFADEGLRQGYLDWAAFPTCAFQPELEEGNKFFKPQRFLGSVRN